ncbi:disulfide bond formation protein DsbB [Ferrimonas lipolytica]|uniref:Disulfide bond formation protein B n=1 Tax=Ferrimonas lipolytica TaxID=2724191 RepID=A0A6H1UEV0_9GAMM|nr:disulfide bond formation protein DsbB [Ferrimonas lipolytica]QIZ76736.1 disulfide bond formation protein DsbB [Ferrimonas lipolytica]
MLNKLFRFSHQRISWLLLAATAIALFVTALWFQHYQHLEPCLLCVYIRVAVVGILLAALVGVVSPQQSALRLTGLAIWIVSALWGLQQSFVLVEKQSGQAPTTLFGNTCDYIPNFPNWMPLHEWLPELFQPRGQCGDEAWQWLGVTMAQWMVIAFSVYLIAALVISISQLARNR